jgi:hypothetical protein
VQKTYDAASKFVARFCEPLFPQTIPDSMKTLIMTILVAASAFGFDCLRRYLQWSDWFTLGLLGLAVLFVSLYVRGHNLIQVELIAKQTKKDEIKEHNRMMLETAKLNDSHMQRMREIEKERVENNKFRPLR